MANSKILFVRVMDNLSNKVQSKVEHKMIELKAKVESVAVSRWCLSGSGSAVFCIFDHMDKQKAKASKCKIDEKFGCKSIIVSNNRW